jgi:GNAT superfamily N-acetyltransferase
VNDFGNHYVHKQLFEGIQYLLGDIVESVWSLDEDDCDLLRLESVHVEDSDNTRVDLGFNYPDSVELRWISIDETHRNKGYGSSVIQYIHDYSRENNKVFVVHRCVPETLRLVKPLVRDCDLSRRWFVWDKMNGSKWCTVICDYTSDGGGVKWVEQFTAQEHSTPLTTRDIELEPSNVNWVE